jgi:hypothetical protein
LKVKVKLDPIRFIEDSGIGVVVDQYFCEFVCGKGEFGKCKYFKRIFGIPVCLRMQARKDKRVLH